jgi:hypothetical protein
MGVPVPHEVFARTAGAELCSSGLSRRFDLVSVASISLISSGQAQKEHILSVLCRIP